MPEVEHAYGRARELCARVGETPQLFPVLWGLSAFYTVQGKLQTAQEMGEQALTLAQRLQDPVFLVGAHEFLGIILFWRGEFLSSRKHFDQCAALYHSDQHASHVLLFAGLDTGVVGRAYSAFTLWKLGYPERALQKWREAFILAQEVNHYEGLAWVFSIASSLHQLRREEQLTQENADATIVLASERGFAMPFALGKLWRGWAVAKQGEHEEGLAQLHEGMDALIAMGAKMGWAWGYFLLADAYAKAGKPETGLKMIAEGMSAVEETDVRAQLSELYRLKAQLLLQSSEHSPEEKVSEAEVCFQRALEVARQQEAKSLELRAATGLARLWQGQGKNAEAQELLSPVYHWFTEGFDTQDLQDAKALLVALR